MANFGFIYCLGNDCMLNTYKIGATERSPTQRCLEISNATGVPVNFDLLCYCEVENPFQVEREIHQELEFYRFNSSREFFNLSLEEVSDTLRSYSINFTETEKGASALYYNNIYKSFVNAESEEKKVIFFKILSSLKGLRIYQENNELFIKGNFSVENIYIRELFPFMESLLRKHLSGKKLPFLIERGFAVNLKSDYFIHLNPLQLIDDDVRNYVKAFRDELIEEIKESQSNIITLNADPKEAV